MDSFQGLTTKSPSSWHRSYGLLNSKFHDPCRRHHIEGSLYYAAGGRLRKLRPDEAWATIERLAQYENEGWNDAFIQDEVRLNYKNPDIEQLLRIIEHKVNTLMKDAISLKGESEIKFPHIVMNFILDQEERVRQLEDYMRAIAEEFMEFSSEVARRLKERIKENENKPRKIEKITKYPDTKVLEKRVKLNVTVFKNLKEDNFPTSNIIIYA
ncbi:hypothetical protein Tco_0878273 [Tanacetum coccineum]|uniref:Uncharacterized protein n=1 Tax=Tanacetum coccineum TaxID=301880 RepID=A0ABQ5BZX0_9ASTR